MEVSVNIYEIGNDTINAMKKASLDIDTNNINDMSKVINNLKSSVEKYHKYSNIGFFSGIFYSELEIKANITIAMINFESNLEKGETVLKNLENQFYHIQDLHDNLQKINSQFEQDLINIDGIIETLEQNSFDQQRMIRRKNDIIAAQILANQTSQQYMLSKNNVSILIDKFRSIEMILKPIIDKNIKLNSNEFKQLQNI